MADSFASPAPSFTIQGSETVTSCMGGFLSLVIMYLVFVFTMLKFQQLLLRENPTINTHIEENAMIDEAFDTSTPEF